MQKRYFTDRTRPEDTLRDTQQYLDLALKGGKIGLWDWNIEIGAVYFSPEWKRQLGYQDNELENRFGEWEDRLHPDDREAILASLVAYVEGQRNEYEVEFRIRHKDGSYRWILSRASIQRGTNDKPFRVSGCHVDITERKRAEEENAKLLVREQDARLEADSARELLLGQNRVLELIAQGAPLEQTLELLVLVIESQCVGMLGSILLLEPDGVHVRCGAAPSLPADFNRAINGQPIGPNAGSCGTAAYRREPVVVEDIATDPLWDSYRDLALAHNLRACWSTPIFDGQQKVLGTFAFYFDTPARPAPKHRQLIDVSTYTAAIAIVKDRESRDRKRTTEEMQRRETQLAEAQRIAALGSYEWDIPNNIVYRSAELCRIFALRPDEFKPTFDGYLERIHPEDRNTTRTVIEKALRDRAPYEFEERIVRPDGAVRLLHSQGRWICDESLQPVRLVGICQDITERRQAEERLRQVERLRLRNEELKAFAYTVSHDLKAPLRAIGGYARELDRQHREGLGERALVCVKQILAATNNLDHMIEDLLDYSRLDVETATASEIDLVQMVEGILQGRAAAVLESGAEVTVDLDVAIVCSWERGLQQVVANLVDNALKYSRNSKPQRIHISSEKHSDAFRIIVSDNGIGFDMKQHDRIFDLFHRLVAQNDFEGTGAGLAIVRKVVDKLRGRIWAEAIPGAGATFFVELPGAGKGD